VISDTAQVLYGDPKWKPLIVEAPEVLGVESFSHAGLAIRVWIVTLPLQQYSVAREFNRRVYIALQGHGIQIGMPQQIVRDAASAEAAPGETGRQSPVKR
jgi:small-conductance mechanosensitive channel